MVKIANVLPLWCSREIANLRLKGSETRGIRHGGGAGWQCSAFEGIDMLVNTSLMTNVQVNMVLTALAVAFGGLILAVVVLLGLA